MAVRCPICGKVCKNRRGLAIHMAKAHGKHLSKKRRRSKRE